MPKSIVSIKSYKNTTLLTIDIECGVDTCASKKGKFCKFFGSRKFGQIPVCTLFPSDISTFTKLEEKEGWTQRCGACKEATK